MVILVALGKVRKQFQKDLRKANHIGSLLGTQVGVWIAHVGRARKEWSECAWPLAHMRFTERMRGASYVSLHALGAYLFGRMPRVLFHTGDGPACVGGVSCTCEDSHMCRRHVTCAAYAIH